MWKVTTRLSYELIEVTLSFLVQTDLTTEREIEQSIVVLPVLFLEEEHRENRELWAAVVLKVIVESLLFSSFFQSEVFLNNVPQQ